MTTRPVTAAGCGVAQAARRALQPLRWGGIAVLALLAAIGHTQPAAPAACAGWTPAEAMQALSTWRQRGASCGAYGPFAPAGNVSWNLQLEGVAREQASWLADHGMLIHTGRAGITLSQRAVAAGYRYAHIAENLAHGQADVAQTLTAWEASDGHCANLFDPDVTEMALACAPAPDGRAMWVLILGRQLRRPGPPQVAVHVPQ